MVRGDRRSVLVGGSWLPRPAEGSAGLWCGFWRRWRSRLGGLRRRLRLDLGRRLRLDLGRRLRWRGRVGPGLALAQLRPLRRRLPVGLDSSRSRSPGRSRAGSRSAHRLPAFPSRGRWCAGRPIICPGGDAAVAGQGAARRRRPGDRRAIWTGPQLGRRHVARRALARCRGGLRRRRDAQRTEGRAAEAAEGVMRAVGGPAEDAVERGPHRQAARVGSGRKDVHGPRGVQ